MKNVFFPSERSPLVTVRAGSSSRKESAPGSNIPGCFLYPMGAGYSHMPVSKDRRSLQLVKL